MKVVTTKIDGKIVGYTIEAENIEDNKVLGSIRNLHFWGFNETAIKYNGMEAESKPIKGKEAVKRLSFIQKAHHPDYEPKIKTINSNEAYDELKNSAIRFFSLCDNHKNE